MCNRIVQDGVVVKPGERVRVLLRGPGGTFEMEVEGAVFAGPARRESRGYWKRLGAEECRVPEVNRFGERSKRDKAQNWEDLPPGATLDGLLLPPEEGREYRLLKVLTQPASPHQLDMLGNDRAPIVRISPPPAAAQCTEPDLPHEWAKEVPTIIHGEEVGTDFACSRCGLTVERFEALTH